MLPVKLAIDSWYVEHATPWIDVLTLVSLVQGIFGVERTLIDRRVRREVAATVVIGVGRQPELART